MFEIWSLKSKQRRRKKAPAYDYYNENHVIYCKGQHLKTKSSWSNKNKRSIDLKLKIKS